MMRLRFPINFISAVMSAMTYCSFAILAYEQYPLSYSPLANWLSDLGNPISNPHGAVFYQIAVIFSAIFLAVWFVGLFQWRLEGNVVQNRLLAISQIAGIFATLGLMMSAIHPINMFQAHSFWSKVFFMLSGMGFGFSVAALRYHPSFTKENLSSGICTAVMPSLMLIFGEAYWLEWIAVGCMILYTISIGIASLSALIQKSTPTRGLNMEGSNTQQLL